MTLIGVTTPTEYVGKDKFEVRTDPFGRCTDKWVHEYKMDRMARYISYCLQAMISPPEFTPEGALITELLEAV